MPVLTRDTRVIITGATSGLGREAARQLGALGCRVAITGRRAAKLANAAEEARCAGAADVLELVGTVTDLDVVRAHFETIRQRWGGLDVAILNAGVGDSDHSRQFSARNYRWHFETNVFGACNWLEAIIPGMIAQGSGVVAGVSSPAAWRGMPTSGPYSASKAALSTLLESVRVDLRGTGVDIVIIYPGFVKSELTDRNDPKDMVLVLDTEDGVRRMLRGIDRRRRVVHFPKRLTIPLRYLLRPMPCWLYDRIASRVVRRNKQPYMEPEEAVRAQHEASPAEPGEKA